MLANQEFGGVPSVLSARWPRVSTSIKLIMVMVMNSSHLQKRFSTAWERIEPRRTGHALAPTAHQPVVSCPLQLGHGIGKRHHASRTARESSKQRKEESWSGIFFTTSIHKVVPVHCYILPWFSISQCHTLPPS